MDNPQKDSRKIEALRQRNGGTLPTYTWPGCYLVVYIDSEGDCFCARCAESGHKYYQLQDYFGIEVGGEADITCAECGAVLSELENDESEDAL